MKLTLKQAEALGFELMESAAESTYIDVLLRDDGTVDILDTRPEGEFVVTVGPRGGVKTRKHA